MFNTAPAVASVLVVIVLLDMSPVAATDAADKDTAVDIEPPVIDPVDVIEPADILLNILVDRPIVK